MHFPQSTQSSIFRMLACWASLSHGAVGARRMSWLMRAAVEMSMPTVQGMQ